MKQILTSQILRKVVILACLIVGLVFVASSSSQAVQARPCCSSCPGGGDPIEAENACAAECGGYSGTCYDDCIRRANNCYRVCSFSC
jgi:hypothetical protein